MNELTIVQNNNIEVVSYPVFSKLYTTVYNSQNRNNFQISGNIQVEHAEQNKIDYLHNLYNDLQIVPTGVQYLSFEDPATQQLCAINWGDGNGVTEQALASVSASAINSAFRSNTNITKFNEFRYFTVATLDMNTTFKDCSSLEEITLPASSNRLRFAGDVFWNCTNLRKINGLENVAQCYDNSTFRQCGIEEIIMPNCGFWARANNDWNQIGSIATSCPNLKKISFQSIAKFHNGFSHGSQWYEAIIAYCSNLEILDLGSSCTTYGGTVFLGTFSNLKAIIFRATTPPTCSTISDDTRMWGGTTAKIYVPASALSTYQATAPFSSLDTAGRLDTIENAIANNIIDA